MSVLTVWRHKGRRNKRTLQNRERRVLLAKEYPREDHPGDPAENVEATAARRAVQRCAGKERASSGLCYPYYR
jgi:hypothetical protein